MTTLAVIGDVHARFEFLDRVIGRIAQVGVDGVLLVGDIGSDDLSLATWRTPEKDARYLASVERVLDAVRGLGKPVLYVPGNHDLPDLAFPGNVDGRVETVGDLRIAGIGGAGPARFGFCYEWDEDEVRAREVPACDVLLCHCPPAGTAIDLTKHGHHVGSEAIEERALVHEGFLVCGHIHEAPGVVQIGACLCLNAGGLGRPHGRPQVGFVRRRDGVDLAWHEDMESGHVRRWTRSA